jgi:Fe-S cluster assembly iron-binding protein IscA
VGKPKEVLSFTERVGEVLRAVLGLVCEPCVGLRICGAASSLGSINLQLLSQPRFNPSDELFVAPEGVLVFVDPTVLPVLRGGTLDGTMTRGGEPRLVLLRQLGNDAVLDGN